MLKIGLTGGIGSGKTIVSQIFKTIGIPIFCADIEAKKTYSDSKIREQIINLFGEKIYMNNTDIDKQMLASKIFGDRQMLEKVNSIIHPAVHIYFEKWFAEQKSPYIIHEAAILLESGFAKFMDKIIVVNAPQNLRIKRIMARGGQSYQQIIKRMKNQMHDEERNAHADFIINNDENVPLLPQVLKIHEELSKYGNYPKNS
ncbi:MAG: dephospho-CoA kinase [Prevotellaceae bacterium]|jgi:dephospho-CoA kinase|nr:dephospho-CoA kinase [Prevotellaceae bacterium]